MSGIDVPADVYDALSKQEFHRLLGCRGVERHFSDADLAADIEYASR